MRRFQDVSISRKLVVVMLATATVALLLATVGFTAHQVVSFRRSMSARLSSLAGILGANSAGALAFQDADAAERVLHSVDGQRDIVSACLYAEAALLAEYRRSSAAGCPDDVGAFGTAADATLVRVQPVMYEDDQIGVIALVADRRELAAMLEQDAIIVLVLLMVGLGATWGMAAFLQRLISRPVLHLVGVAIKRPQFSWTLIRGESNVQGGGGNGSIEERAGEGVGGDGGSPEGDRSARRRRGR